MNETKSLVARSRKYLESARLLIENGDFESAVSRSFYAMFYSAEAALLEKGVSSSSHKAVLSAFGEHFVKTGIFTKDLSRSLIRAFEKRQLSDYEFTFVISEEEAQEILREAENFVRTISDYLNK